MSNSTVKNSTNEIFTSSESLFKNNDLIAALQNRGIIPDVTITDSNLMKFKQSKAKREYKNTKLLLENYRTITIAVAYLPQQIASELNMPFKNIDELIEKCDIASTYNDTNIDEKLRSVMRTKQLIDVVNRALTSMKNMPNDGELFYKILYYTYLSSKPLKIDSILEKLNISRSSYFRKREEAIKLFGSILWLAPNREVDLWIDFITILNYGK